jgi:hypothetical protein
MADLHDLTNDELRAELDERGIEYTTRLTKDELIALLEDGPDVDPATGDEAETEPNVTEQLIIGPTGAEVLTDTGIDYAGEGLIGPKDEMPVLHPGDVVGEVTLPEGHDDAAASATEQRAEELRKLTDNEL